MSDSQLLTPLEVCVKLGWDVFDTENPSRAEKKQNRSQVRKLMGYIRARERRFKVKILQPAGDREKGRGIRFKITMKSMRRHCSELFVRQPSELLPQFKQMLLEVKQDLDDRIVEMTLPKELEQDEKIRFLSEQLLEQRKDLQNVKSVLGKIQAS